MKRWLFVLTALSLLALLLPACGGGGDGDETTPAVISTLSDTRTPTEAPTVTPNTAAGGPIKVGVIGPWSGPMAVSGGLADQAIAVIEQQLKDTGGILGGRQVEFVRGDDSGAVAQAVGQARKLAQEQKVDILCFGGVTGASFQAVAKEAEDLKIPYVSPSVIYGGDTMKYNISMTNAATIINRTAGFSIEYIKPKTVAFLSYDDEAARHQMDGQEGAVGVRERWKENKIDFIYEQYFAVDTVDFSPYLTAIRYKKPDLAIINTNNAAQGITINKQIQELGGWGDVKVFYSNSIGQKGVLMPAAVGAYMGAEWIPGSNDPGMKTFEDAFKKTHGRTPTPELAYFYNNFWLAIKAIELAGTTDHEKVAQAMRSGKLEWDSAWGHTVIRPDGRGDPKMSVVQIQEGGKLVKVWPQ